MTAVDLLIAGVLAGGLLIGLRSGLIKQALGLLGAVLGFLLALQLMDVAGKMVTTSLGVSADLAPLLGFVLVFGAVQIGVFAATRLGESVIGALRLTTLNRILGGAVGAGKAALVLSIAFLVVAPLGVPTEETQRDSALYAPVASAVPLAWGEIQEWFPHLESLAEKFGTEIRERL